jgi:hypothetical protein
MTATIEILDRRGNPLTQLGTGEFQLGTRSWCLTEAGDADFDVPRNNPKVCEANLSAPNIVRIRSSTGIPGWYGPITRVRWTSPEWVNVTCESGETLLRQTAVIITPTSVNHTSMTAGAFLLQALQAAIAHGKTGFSIGNIDLGGPVLPFTSQASDLWEQVIPTLRGALWPDAHLSGGNTAAANCFWVDENGACQWQPQRGQDRRQTCCIHVGAGGVCYSTPTFEENYRDIVTYGFGLGNDSNWDEKAIAEYSSPSVARWGVRDGTKDATGNRGDQAEQAARQAITDKRRALDITIDNEDAAWLRFWLGDIILVSDPRSYWPEAGGLLWGCRVEGIEVEEEAQRMRVIGKEWTAY